MLFITHNFHSFHSFLSRSLGSSLLASPVREVWFWKVNGIVSGECRDLYFRNLPTLSLSLSLYLSSSFLKPQICLLFHSCHQLNQGTGMGLCFIDTCDVCRFYCRFSFRRSRFNKGRNSRVKECQTNTQKHWNTVMSSCLGREGQRDRPSASLLLSMKRSGMKEGWRVRCMVEEVVLLGGKGQLAAGLGGGVTLCGMWSDSDHLW